MIQLKKLTAGYSGKPVVQEITLDFLPGEVLVLLGPNGSGKSTLLKAALGLIPLMSGQALYDGVDIREMNRRQVAQRAAFLTQSRNIPSIQALRMVLLSTALWSTGLSNRPGGHGAYWMRGV